MTSFIVDVGDNFAVIVETFQETSLQRVNETGKSETFQETSLLGRITCRSPRSVRTRARRHAAFATLAAGAADADDAGH